MLWDYLLGVLVMGLAMHWPWLDVVSVSLMKTCCLQ